jgi:hypothetical protein
MRDRFKNAHISRQLHRQGSESVDGQTPRELQQPYRQQELSKAQLRQILIDALANTVRIQIRRVPPKRGAS